MSTVRNGVRARDLEWLQYVVEAQALIFEKA